VELIIENIRCFAGRHTIPIKPITFLTGENSSGKSTILACLSVINDFGFPLQPRLNEPPFSLGNFDTIATYKSGRGGRADTFSLGYRRASTGERTLTTILTEIVAAYTGGGGAVELSRLACSGGTINALINIFSVNGKILLEYNISRIGEPPHHVRYTYESRDTGYDSKSVRLDPSELLLGLYEAVGDEDNDDFKLIRELRRGIFNATSTTRRGNRTVAIAPIRTKPSRTYDQVAQEFTPEGEHMPFVLPTLLKNTNAKDAFERFGKDSGLFRQINVRYLGNKTTGSVQVLVTSGGRPANLIDVGYGVSQALPVVVESMLVSPERLLLLQQPEVHLHPRAQAALGTLFVDLHAENEKQFVIETHSDYIIDRVRQEVARGRVEADDVQILYFEKRGSETTVFPIAIDERGNVVDPPPSYRDFFMEEEINLLSRAKE